MGFKDTEWAYSLDLPFTPKAVLAAICSKTDDRTHETIVGQQTVVEMTGASEKTVRRALGVLEDLGVITREHRTGKGGYRTSDRTVVNIAYRSESPDGDAPHLPVTEPSGHTAQWAESPRLPVTLSTPTGHSDRAEEIIQIDHSEDHSDISPSTDLELIPAATIEPSSSFDDFWAAWPRKDGKKAATLAWAKAIRRVPATLIVDAARTYSTSLYRPAKQFVPHGATWLNGDRWNDPPPEAPEADQRRQTTTQGNLNYLATLQARENAEHRGLTA
jgi:hypothetical protein